MSLLDAGLEGVYVVDMKNAGKFNWRKRSLVGLFLASLLLIGVACSDGVRDSAKSDSASRDASSGISCVPAAGARPGTDASTNPFVSNSVDAEFADHGARGNSHCDVNVPEWCLTNVNYGAQLPDIAMCMVFNNKARKFTAPGELSGTFPLTAVSAYCVNYSQSGLASEGYLDDLGLCDNTMSGYRGSVRVYNTANTKYGDEARLLYPNPFYGVGAIQFMPWRQSTGTANQVQINSKMSPLSEAQASARPAAYSPFSGSNSQTCEGQGAWLYCKALPGLQPKSWVSTALFDIGNFPVQFQFTNNTPYDMRLKNSASGPGFLLDPAGFGVVKPTNPNPTTTTTSPNSPPTTAPATRCAPKSGELSCVPPTATAYIGGYLTVSSTTDEMSWTGNFVLDTIVNGSYYEYPVTVTFLLKLTKDKDAVDPNIRSYTSASSCNAKSPTAQISLTCNQPVFNNSVANPIVTADVNR